MEQFLAIIAFAGILLAVLSGLTCVALARKLREVTHKQQVLATDVDYRFNEVRQNLNALAQHTTAQLQRLAQRPSPSIPQPKTQSAPSPSLPTPEMAAATVAAQTANGRPSVTERRHRVLTLARRGMDVKAIAQTLGMPHGEVALIIRMSNPSFGD